jgi:adenylosuccinate lyase
VIGRYTLPEMGTVWTDEARFEQMLRVEIAALRAVESRGLVPAGVTDEVASKARIDVERIAELEQTTDHDVIAFVSQVAETVGSSGRFVHFGLTSSDVVRATSSIPASRSSAGQLQTCSSPRPKHSLRRSSPRRASTPRR